MSSIWGERLKISLFGESHGNGIGVVLDGLPAGEAVDMEEVMFHLRRRAPGKDAVATARREADMPEILSGIFNNSTNGAPLCAIIRNSDSHSADYTQLSHIPRPGHADYTGYIRYNGHQDYRGGGHFSGRLTAPLVFAGAVCRQILSRRGVEIGAHLLRAGGVSDSPFDAENIDAGTLKALTHSPFPVLDPRAGEAMRAAILAAKDSGDSVGGVVECAAAGLPAGLGDPIFGGVENKLASIIFGIPAVKGLEFGAGFAAADLLGSQNNDPFYMDGDVVKTKGNRHGGVLGGITTGMPLVFAVAFKPTPSIRLRQRSVDLSTRTDTDLSVHGRHDPCVAVRAVPVVESAAAIGLLDLFLGDCGNGPGFSSSKN